MVRWRPLAKSRSAHYERIARDAIMTGRPKSNAFIRDGSTDRCTISDQELGASFLPPGVLEVPDFSADRGTRCASSHRGASVSPLHASPASLCHTQSRWLADRENSVGRAASAPTHGAHLVGGPWQTSARNGCIAAHGRGAPVRCVARPSARQSEAAA